MKWLTPLLVMMLYVHLFNAVSHLYFASGRTLTLSDLWDHCKHSLQSR